MSKSPLIKILSYSLIKELYKHHNSVLILEASGSQCICVWVLLSQCKYFTLYWYLSLEMDFFLIPVTRSLKPGTKYFYSHSLIQKLFLQHLLQDLWRALQMCVCVVRCPVVSSATLWTVDRQAPLSMEFSRHEYWNGLPFSSPGELPDQGSNWGLPHYGQILYCLSHQGSPLYK